MIRKYLEEIFYYKGLHELNLRFEISSNLEKDFHQAVFIDLNRNKKLFTVFWDEKGFRQADIEFKDLDLEEDKSLVKGLDFYLKSKKTTMTHIMFRNYENFMQFFDIIIIGSLKKIW